LSPTFEPGQVIRYAAVEEELGQQALVAYGRIEYRDAFRKDRWTTFRYINIGLYTLGTDMQLHRDGNAADEDRPIQTVSAGALTPYDRSGSRQPWIRLTLCGGVPADLMRRCTSAPRRPLHSVARPLLRRFARPGRRLSVRFEGLGHAGAIHNVRLFLRYLDVIRAGRRLQKMSALV
jgi:hypothetical protein